MSDFTWYDAGTTTIGVNAEEVSQRLGELRRKTPAVIKVAVNATARETRKEMLRLVLKRYALTAKGKERAKGLKQKVKATNADPAAVLWIGGINGARADLAYFQHRVTVPHPGLSWQTGPTVFKARVLRSGGLHDLGAQKGSSPLRPRSTVRPDCHACLSPTPWHPAPSNRPRPGGHRANNRRQNVRNKYNRYRLTPFRNKAREASRYSGA